jgi:hypothetical protein
VYTSPLCSQTARNVIQPVLSLLKIHFPRAAPQATLTRASAREISRLAAPGNCRILSLKRVVRDVIAATRSWMGRAACNRRCQIPVAVLGRALTDSRPAELQCLHNWHPSRTLGRNLSQVLARTRQAGPSEASNILSYVRLLAFGLLISRWDREKSCIAR